MARPAKKDKKVRVVTPKEKEVEVTQQPSQESDAKSQSESEPEQQEGISDLEEDDEFDVNEEVEVSEDDEERDSSSEEEEGDDPEDDSFPLKKKRKKNIDDGSESFATAFNAIMGSKLKAYNRKDPILARNKSTLKQIENDTLEQKAKRAILAEKKHKMDKHRIRNLLPASDQPETVRQTLEFERLLKKTAQKGVVRLFNAVLTTQVGTNQQIAKEKVGSKKKEELMTEISKEKFLDLVQAAGQS